MKALTALAIALGILWLTGVTVIAVWPVVADAPWESGDTNCNAIRCEAALERRLAAEQRLMTPVSAHGRDWPMTAASTFDDEVAALNQTIAAAERDISEFCR